MMRRFLPFCLLSALASGAHAMSDDELRRIAEQRLDLRERDRIRRVGILLFNDDGAIVTDNLITGVSTDESADAIGIAAGIQNVTATASSEE